MIYLDSYLEGESRGVVAKEEVIYSPVKFVNIIVVFFESTS
jgi:hypothetical protein